MQRRIDPEKPTPPSDQVNTPLDPTGRLPVNLGWLTGAAVTMLAALLPAVLWPGDTPWTNDEPALIANAFHANQAFRLADKGLVGSLRLNYGPLPTQIYQGLLLLTHDPLNLVVLHAALCAGVTASSLLWLARVLRFNPWFPAAVMLAPCVYLFNRILWDATFVVPLGSLALAAFASFLQTRSRRALLVTLACASSLPLIHPQTLPLFAALVGYLVWRHRPALWKHRVGVVAVALVLLGLNAGYFTYVATAVTHITQLVKPGYGARIPAAHAALTPLRGGQLLWDAPISAGIERLGGIARGVQAAITLSRGVELLVWAGAALAAWRTLRRVGWVRAPGAPSVPVNAAVDVTKNPRLPAGVQATRDRLLCVAVATLAMQVVLYAVVGLPPWASYYFGPFPTTVLFAWVAVEALARLRLRGVVMSAYGLCVAVVTLAGIWQLHRFGWPRGSMSPNLRNQVEVARALKRYSDGSALTDVTVYQTYPRALWTLRLLLGPSAAPRTESGRLVIRYRSEQGSGDGRIELLEGGAPAYAAPVALNEAP